MIRVLCPACGKAVGFEESDAGSLVACPHCRQTFFVPVMAQPVTPADATAPPPVAATRLPIEPTLPDLDEIRIAADPDLDPAPEKIDEVELADEPPPPAPEPEPEPPPEPTPLPPDPIPYLELDPRPEPVETVEPVGIPKEVEPTDLAPTLEAAEVLSQSLPEADKPIRPTDVLEEVEEKDDRYEDREDDGEEVEVVEEEEERPRRKPKRRKSEYRTPVHGQKPLTEGSTRNRILGGVGAGTGGMLLLGTLAHHLTATQNAWHPGVCCADIFALALVGVGIFFLIRG